LRSSFGSRDAARRGLSAICSEGVSDRSLERFLERSLGKVSWKGFWTSSPIASLSLEKIVISFAKRFVKRSRSASVRKQRQHAIGVALESLEMRILFTWQGATSGNTNDAAHQYNNLANWSSGVIEDSFAGATFTANTTLFMTASHTTGAGGLNLGYTGNFNLTIMSSSATTWTLTLAGDISAAPANQTVTLGDVAGADDVSIAVGAANRTFNTAGNETLNVVNVVSGAHSVTAAGTGTLTLSGVNTYTGGTTLTSGELDINSAKALGTGAFTINGGTIDNSSGAAVTLTNNNTQTWGANYTFIGSNALNMGTGAVTLSASRIVTVSASMLTEGGIVAGAFSLTKAGAGTLTLAGADTFSGGMTLSAGQLNINNAKSVGTGTFAINGGSIDNTTAASITFNTNNVETWGGDFTFVGTQALNMGSGAVTLGASRTVMVSGSTLTDGGIIGDSGSAFSLTKSGTGALLLSGANTFSGGITLSAGQLDVNAVHALGTGTFTINGGSIDNTTAAAITLTTNNLQTWGGDFTFVGTKSLNLGTGAVTLGGNRAVTVSGSTLTVGGAVGDGGNTYSLTKAGAGTLAMTASGTYAGGTILNAGILSFANGALGSGNFTFGGSSTLQWNGTNTQDISSAIQAIGSGVTASLDTNGNNVTLASILSGAGAITKLGAGALTLSGANTFQGGLTLSAGSVNINNATALGTGTFTIGAGLTIDNTSTGAIIESNNNAQIWGGSFTFTGTNALNLGSGAVTMSAAVTITTTASTLTVGGAIGDGGSAFLLTKAGAGTLGLGGANTHSGGTKITAGVLLLANAAAVGTGTFTVNAGVIDNTSGSAMTLTNNNAINFGGNFTFTGTNDLNLGTGAVTLAANTTITASASVMTIGGAITGAKSLSKSGNGTLTLSGSNGFTNGVTLSAGQLNINTSTALGTGTFSLGGGIIDNTSSGALALTNAQTISNSFTFVGSNNLSFGTGAVTLSGNITATITAGTLAEGGAISGAKSIAKTGAGTLTLSGNNTFTNGVTLTLGQLNINSATALGTGTFSINGGTIDNTSGSAITMSSNNAQTWGGGFGFIGTSDLNLGTGAVNLSGSRIITTTTGDLTIGGVVSGAHQLTVTGTGTLTLSGANTYSGGTVLSSGQLNINSATALGTNTFAINGGTIDNTSGSAITFTNNIAQTWGGDFTFIGSNALSLGTGVVTLSANRIVTISASTLTEGGIIAGAAISLTEAGAGTLAVTGSNTFSGGLTISGGTYLANDAAGSGTGSGAVTVNSGGTLGGTGTASGAVTVNSGGTLAPGNGATTSIFKTGNLTLASGSNLDIVLNGNTAGTGYDQVSVTGTVNVTGSTLALSGTRTAHDGTLLTIITNDAADAITGTFSGLAEGGTTIFSGVTYTATYQGGTGNDAVLTADPAATTGAVVADNNPSVVGQSVTFTATISSTSTGTPTGNVTFFDGATNLGTTALNGSAVATLSTSALTLGSHSITAVYAGDTNFAGSTSPIMTQTVNQAATTSAVVSSANPSVFGQSITFTATVTTSAPGAGVPTGSVTFMDGATTLGTGTLNGSGQTTLITSALSLGSHSITVVYAGDTNYTTSTSSTLSQTVNQAATTSAVASSANPSVVGQSVTFTATVTASAPGSGTPTGTVTFNDGATTLGTGTLDGSGQTTLITSALSLGGHSITVVYAGDTNFTASTSSTLTQTVNQAATTSSVASSANPSVVGQSVTFTATVAASAPGSGTPTGTVTFKDGATTLGTGTLNGSGQTTLITSALSLGGHSITVVYAGDTNYTTSTSSTLTQTVNQAATASSVASSANPSVVGQSITFTATITASTPGSGIPTGTVTFKDGATTLGTGTLDGSGQTTLITSALSLGSHSITVVYAGDANYTTSTSSTLTQTVNQAATTSSVASSANPSVFGQSVTFTATVAASAPGSGIPTGTVTFKDGATTFGTGTLDGSGQTTLITSALSLGSHSITVVYAGDTNYTTSTSSTLTQTVNQAATTSSVASSANPSVFGQSVTFTATVAASAPGSGTPTGTVTFKDGATTLGTGTLDGSGQTTISTSALSIGSHSITVVYAGDTNYTTSTSSALSQTVNQAATTSSVASSANPSVFGQSVTFTATVAASAPGAGLPTGLVTFKDGATTLGTGTLDGSGQTTFSTSALSVGSHSITVVYAGDTDFTTSTSSTLSQTINQAATTSSVASSANPSVFGQSVTFTATITASAPGAGIPTGTVTFLDGATTLGTGTLDGSGETTFSTSALSVGSHSITVVYAGDTDFTTSTSSALTQTVDQASTTSSVASSANPSVSGQSVTFTATVTASAPGAGIPTGTVTFLDGVTTLGTGTLDGSGQTTLSTSALSVGSHSITVVYAGDTDFTTSTSSALSQTVNQAATTSSIASSANPSVFGQSVTFTATVTASAPGSGIPTGTVTFKDGATTLGIGTLDGSGQTTFSTSALSVGSHSITVIYAGDTDFTTSTSSALSQTVNQAATTSSVASSANPAVFGQSVTFTATVAASAPGAGIPTGLVTFKDGATTLGTGTLDGSGQTTFSTSALSVASHSITVVYAGDTDFTTSTSSALSQVINQSATTSSVASSANPSVSGQSVTFTATVAASAPGAGTPTGTVTFKDGATTLGTGTLDGSGQTTFSTSALSVGSHSITIVYAGDTNFATSTSSALSQTINQAATTSSVASSINPTVFGQSVTFTATITSDAPGSGVPTGIVTFMDGATSLGTNTLDGSGQTTLSTSALSVGSHSITIVYTGDTDFSTSTSSAVSQTVNQAATTSSVASSANPSVFGQSVTFTATVAASAPGAGIPTGLVTFMDGATALGTGTLDGSGQTTFTTSALLLGGHSITVVYAGDTDFTTSASSALTQTVDQAATATAVTSSAAPSVVGQSVTFTATVSASAPGSGTPTGTVTFEDGATILGTNSLDGSGVATFSISSLVLGSHSITAIYAGDANFTGSTSSISTQVVDQDSTTSAVIAAPEPVAFSQLVTFTGTVTAAAPGAGTPTGTLTFQDGATTLGSASLNGSGQATFSIASLALGSHAITVVYGGDSNFTGSTSAAFTESVDQTPPSMVVFDQQPTSATAGVTISPNITVDVEDPFGNIVGSDSSDVTLAVATGPGSLLGTVTVTAVNGVATFTGLSIDVAGSYTLSATDGTLAGATSSSFTISPAAASKVAFVQQPLNSTAGDPISPAVTVGVEDQFGNIVTTDSSNVTLSAASGPSALLGTLTIAAQNGLATFNDLTLDTDGSYTLSAVDGSLSPAASNSFTISPSGTPSTLQVAQQPTTLPAGTDPAAPLVIQIKDQHGNTITGFDSQVSLSIISGPTGGVLAGTPTVTAINGVATFSDIQITHAGTYVLAASINGGIVAESAPIQIDPGPATQNLVMQQPSPSWQYGAITPIVVNVTDQFGNPVTVPGGTVSASLSSGPSGAMLTGTTTVAAVGGRATFSNLSVNIPGMYTLVFASSGNSPAVTESFEVVSIPAQRFTFNGSPISSRSILMQQRRNAPTYINLGPPSVAFSVLVASQNHFSAAPAVVIDPQSFLNAISALDPSLLKKLLD
jgi:autotransporter-associated beta strand protein